MENLLTAKEAKELSIQGQKNLFNNCLTRIKNATETGATSAIQFTEIKNEENTEPITIVVDRLTELGYNVKYEYSKILSEFKITITW